MRKVGIIGLPIDLGANRRGVDMGPSALRVTGLANRLKQLGYDVIDKGDVDVPLPEECDIGEANKKYAEDIKDVCEDLCEAVYKSLKEDRLPVVLGGDHTLAMGSTAAVSKFYKEKNMIRLEPANSSMSPIYTTNVQIQGRVVGLIRKYSA